MLVRRLVNGSIQTNLDSHLLDDRDAKSFGEDVGEGKVNWKSKGGFL